MIHEMMIILHLGYSDKDKDTYFLKRKPWNSSIIVSYKAVEC